MRDIDLFVGVGTVANDPDRLESHHNGQIGFEELNETALTRRGVLESLIPKLSIGESLRLDNRFLVVKGAFREYKIHLGSANVLMSPNDQYLWFVQKREKKVRILLPFEGDRTLSLILSKAQLLANDKKIKDPSILSQINVA